jgi:hypothetical protein
MYKYFKVKTTQSLGFGKNEIIVEKTEYATAKSDEAVTKDYVGRLGSYLMCLDVTEIAETKIPKRSRIYAIV